MKNKKLLMVILGVFLLSSCNGNDMSASTPTFEISTSSEAEETATAIPVENEIEDNLKHYSNEIFGFSFSYPANWFGPDEYVADQTLRVEIGSDVVFPYGTGIEDRIFNENNSYYITIQYTLNDQNSNWLETYQTLQGLKDGESISDARSTVIRVREVQLGMFVGMEYISTLSETAQTEPVFTRNVILYDDQSNVLSIMGTPNNVEIDPQVGWRTAFQMIDEENVELFESIVNSVQIK